MFEFPAHSANVKSQTGDLASAPTENLNIELNERSDTGRLRQRFKKYGRVQIPNFLTENAAHILVNTFTRHDRWNLVTNFNGQHMDLDERGMAKLSTADRNVFTDRVHAQAREDFQYLFSNYPIYDAYHSGTLDNPVIKKLFRFLNDSSFLDLLRHICADTTISFADAQATRYEAGHFLTEHDDDVEGKNRRCAYVLNLTPHWRPDWGGLLQFYDKNGNVEEAYTPRFNALNIFKVPQKHSVSSVAPFANGPRLSVTGWLRAGKNPMANAAAAHG